MLILLLIIAFSSLTFDGLTIQGLLNWLNVHPFITLFWISYIFNKGSIISIINKN